MKKIAILFSLILYSVIFAQTQAEMNIESYESYKKSDRQLNLVYGQILKKYAKDKVFLNKLKVAQNLWIKFRDAEAAAKYPEEDKQFEYGTIFPMCYNVFMQQLTEERTAKLKIWLDGYSEGDVCNGSVK